MDLRQHRTNCFDDARIPAQSLESNHPSQFTCHDRLRVDRRLIRWSTKIDQICNRVPAELAVSEIVDALLGREGDLAAGENPHRCGRRPGRSGRLPRITPLHATGLSSTLRGWLTVVSDALQSDYLRWTSYAAVALSLESGRRR